MGPPPGLFAEIARWRDKAQRKGICTFTSSIIPHWLNHEIVGAMEAVGPVAAFSFLKAKPETRDQIERRLRKKLDALYAKFNPRVARAIRRGEQPDYDKIFEELRAAIQPEVTQLTTVEALRLSVDTGIVFDPAVINTHAVEWARGYTFELVRGINATTRKLVSQAQQTFFETPGMTQGDLEKILTHAFGPVRAEMIATTEATRAASEATNEVQRLVNEVGVPMTRQWHTANDDIVCPICGPLNGQPEIVWAGEFPNGPPAHVNCRCSTGLTVADDEELIAEAEALVDERVQMLRATGQTPQRPVSEQERELSVEIAEIEPMVREMEAAGDPTGGGMKGYLDSLQKSLKEEQDINKALYDKYAIMPNQATPRQWRAVADELQDQGYVLYKKYTKEGINLRVAEQRGAKASGYMVIGKEQVLVRTGAFSARTAQRMEGTLWKEGKAELADAAGEMLQRAGFTSADIAQASYEQRIKLLSEVGQKDLLRTGSGRVSKIDAVPVESREQVVDTVDFDLAAMSENSAIDPLSLPTLDAYGKMELADIIRTTKLDEPEDAGGISELNF